MRRPTLTLALGCLLLASHAEAARWKIGTGPAGAQTRATYPSGTCYWDTTDSGPDQCRYKALSATSCQFVQESGANQCTPTSTPPPAPVKAEWARMEGTKVHVYSNDGVLQFDHYLESNGAFTATWRQGSETVTLAASSSRISVTRNGVTTVMGTDAQNKALGAALVNSAAVQRFQVRAITKYSAAKARSATATVSGSNRIVETVFFQTNALVDTLTGEEHAFENNDQTPGGGSQPDPGNTQHDCLTDWEIAQNSYVNQFRSCLNNAYIVNGYPTWGTYWMPHMADLCSAEYVTRSYIAVFQLAKCATIPKL